MAKRVEKLVAQRDTILTVNWPVSLARTLFLATVIALLCRSSPDCPSLCENIGPCSTDSGKMCVTQGLQRDVNNAFLMFAVSAYFLRKRYNCHRVLIKCSDSFVFFVGVIIGLVATVGLLVLATIVWTRMVFNVPTDKGQCKQHLAGLNFGVVQVHTNPFSPLLLLLCGDVELNPGPTTQEMIKELGSTLGNRLDAVSMEMRSLSSAVTDISTQMEQRQHDINDVKKTAHELQEQIWYLEEQIERQEIVSRKDNIIFFGVPENFRRRETEETLIDTMVNIFNQHDVQGWTPSDLGKAHRLGKVNREATRPRPVLVKMIRNRDKRRLIASRDVRKRMQKVGIDMKDDLTVKQRDKLNQMRDDGYMAYYRGTQLVTRPREDLAASGGHRGVDQFEDTDNDSDVDQREESDLPGCRGPRQWRQTRGAHSELPLRGGHAPDPSPAFPARSTCSPRSPGGRGRARCGSVISPSGVSPGLRGFGRGGGHSSACASGSGHRDNDHVLTEGAEVNLRPRTRAAATVAGSQQPAITGYMARRGQEVD